MQILRAQAQNLREVAPRRLQLELALRARAASNLLLTPQTMSQSEDTAQLAHYDYDRDDALPRWWRAIFWGAIVVAAGSYVWL